MMNKKRLAVLAMSAVMAASTVSVPVGAADFSDGAAGAEAQAATETADFSADVDTQALETDTADVPAVSAAITSITEKEWRNVETDSPSLVVTETYEDGSSKDITITTGFSKQEVEATCQQEGGYTWAITYNGKPFSYFVKTSEKTDHNYVEEEETLSLGNCTTETNGQVKITVKCSVCGHIKEERTESVPYSHSWDGEPVITYVLGDNTKYVNDDNTIPPVLENKGKAGSYIKVTSRYCKACQKIIETPETINLPAEEIVSGTTIKISDLNNIKTDLTKIEDINDIPDEEDIELTDCTKDGSYVVTYIDENNGTELDSKTVTVKAHHIMKVTGFDYVNEADEKENHLAVSYDNDGNPILDKDGHLVVVNNTCLKDVDYYEISTCTVCGKNETKTKMTAPKSDKHVVDTTAQAKVQKHKDMNETVKYEDLLADIGGEDNEYVKIVNVTATCEKAGTADVEFSCKVCGEKAATISGVKVEALGHNYVTKAENVKEATCTSSGSYEAVTVCERCGLEKERKDIIIKRLAHTNETAVDTNGNGTDNTKGDKGSDVSISFVGSLVFGPYSKGHVDADGKIGSVYDETIDGTLKYKVVTNCAVCHNHEVVLDNTNDANRLKIEVKAVENETVNPITEKVTAPGSITLVATYVTDEEKTITKEITLPYFSEPMDTTLAYTGLHKDVDGVYRYYVDGDFAEDYVGMVEFDGKEFYVENGVISTGTHGIKLVGDKFYFFAYGQVQDYTGIAQYDGEFFSVVNGELNTDVSGLVDYDGGTFLFADGRLVKEHNGLWQNFDGDWYYLANGQVQKQYTGLALYDGEWFYVVEGVLAEDYTGTVEYDGAEFKVVNGMVQ